MCSLRIALKSEFLCWNFCSLNFSSSFSFPKFTSLLFFDIQFLTRVSQKNFPQSSYRISQRAWCPSAFHAIFILFHIHKYINIQHICICYIYTQNVPNYSAYTHKMYPDFYLFHIRTSPSLKSWLLYP